MNCKRIRLLISAAVDGELSEREHAILDKHLASCESCRAQQIGFTELREALALWPDEEPSPWLVENFAYKLAQQKEAEVQQPRSRRRWMFGTAVAGVATALLLGGFFLTHRLSTPEVWKEQKPSYITSPMKPPVKTTITTGTETGRLASKPVATVPSAVTFEKTKRVASEHVGAQEMTEHRDQKPARWLKKESRVIRTAHQTKVTASAPAMAHAPDTGEPTTQTRELLNMIAAAEESRKETPAFVVASLGETGLAMNEAMEIIRGTLRKVVDQLEARETSVSNEGGTL